MQALNDERPLKIINYASAERVCCSISTLDTIDLIWSQNCEQSTCLSSAHLQSLLRRRDSIANFQFFVNVASVGRSTLAPQLTSFRHGMLQLHKSCTPAAAEAKLVKSKKHIMSFHSSNKYWTSDVTTISYSHVGFRQNDYLSLI